jgi:hypothetical protein
MPTAGPCHGFAALRSLFCCLHSWQCWVIMLCLPPSFHVVFRVVCLVYTQGPAGFIPAFETGQPGGGMSSGSNSSSRSNQAVTGGSGASSGGNSSSRSNRTVTVGGGGGSGSGSNSSSRSNRTGTGGAGAGRGLLQARRFFQVRMSPFPLHSMLVSRLGLSWRPAKWLAYA